MVPELMSMRAFFKLQISMVDARVVAILDRRDQLLEEEAGCILCESPALLYVCE